MFHLTCHGWRILLALVGSYFICFAVKSQVSSPRLELGFFTGFGKYSFINKQESIHQGFNVPYTFSPELRGGIKFVTLNRENSLQVCIENKNYRVKHILYNDSITLPATFGSGFTTLGLLIQQRFYKSIKKTDYKIGFGYKPYYAQGQVKAGEVLGQIGIEKKVNKKGLSLWFDAKYDLSKYPTKKIQNYQSGVLYKTFIKPDPFSWMVGLGVTFNLKKQAL